MTTRSTLRTPKFNNIFGSSRLDSRYKRRHIDVVLPSVINVALPLSINAGVQNNVTLLKHRHKHTLYCFKKYRQAVKYKFFSP